MTRYGMVIDLKRCIGCLACVVACKVEHYTGPGVFWTYVEDEEIGKYPSVSRRFIPRGCMHCKNAPCVDTCPTGASHQREDGIVLVDGDQCIGCQACIVACPYGARYFLEENRGYYKAGVTPYELKGFEQHRPGVVEKCTFCQERLAVGEEPACVRVCLTKCRKFGDLDDPKSEVSELIRSRHGFQLHKDLGTDPSIYYLAP